MLAGATVGGGTRINWAASFKLPPHVRKEWAEEHGLADFNGPRFDRAMDAVFDRVGVTTGAAFTVHLVVGRVLPLLVPKPLAKSTQAESAGSKYFVYILCWSCLDLYSLKSIV